MANTGFRLNHRNSAFQVFGLFSIVFLMGESGAFEFKVGGSNGWTIPTDPNVNTLNQWAESHRFKVGDSLLFAYATDKDTVLLHVNNDDYANCNTDSPIDKFSGGHTVFTFTHSGPYYFISGNKENCKKNQKMVIVVLGDRTQSPTTAPVASPPPSPPPSPAPAGQESPSPPPPEGINPTPSPESNESPPPPNAASSIVTSFMGSIVAFVGSSFLLVL